MARRFMKPGDVVEMAVTYFPSFLRSRRTAIRLDGWMRGEHYDLGNIDSEIDEDAREWGQTFSPRAEETSGEYENLQSITPNNFAGLVVASLQQTAYIEGIRRPGVKDQLPVWQTFRRNRWLSKQSAIHRTAIGLSQAYGVVVPGSDPLTGASMSKMVARSPKRMAAFYDSDDDEFPVIAIDALPRYDAPALGRAFQTGWTVTIFDAYVVHHLSCTGQGLSTDDWTYISYDEHDLPVCPVARCVNRLDLDGRATGEIEPVLPLLRRIDQDVFDRLIIQRFGAWQVRYIAGMAKPDKKDEARAQALQLRVEDILISTDKETKFGVLPGAPLDPQIAATDADLRLLAAITQTPPHHLLGLSSNLQAEALAAAESGLQRKSFDFRTNAGEFHETMARLVAMADGDMATAAAFDIQVRWKDTESRSMTQAADALGKLAVQLKVPVEMLWEKIPGWTDDDVQRAKELVEDGTFETLINELLGNTGSNDTGTTNPPSEPAGGTGGNGNE